MNKVKEFRVKQKMKQVELASKSGISRTYLSLIETGKVKNINLKTMQKISLTLNKKVQDVFLLDLNCQ